MPLTCPLCRASNDTGPACRRCRADLSMLFALEAQRDAELAAAARELAQGHAGAAFLHARRADDLRRDADSAMMLAMSALLRRDFAAALHQHRRAQALSRT